MRKHIQPYFQLICISLLLLSWTSCKQVKKENPTKLIISVPSDANSLNPLKARGETSNYLCLQIFQTLMGFDYNTGKQVSIVAENPPQSEIISESQIAFHYQLRKEARFNDGSPIDAKDIYFSFLLANCPKASFPGSSNFYSFIDSVVWDINKPKEISFICQNNYFLNKYATSDFFILPQKIYDPNLILTKYSLKEIRSFDESNLPENLEKFTTNFNKQKYEKDPRFIDGSGAYKVTDWQSNQRIVLKKKENWWGEGLSGTNSFFDAFPETIQYEVIADQTASIAALKSGSIDLIKGVKPKDFSELKNANKLNSTTSDKMGYSYLGFNLTNDHTSKLRLRKGIAFLVDKETILKQVRYNIGKSIISPIFPSDKQNYAESLKIYKYNLDSARLYLEPYIDLEEKLVLDYVYNADNEQRKMVGLILQDQLKDFGIQLNLIASEWSVYLEKIKTGDFDLFYGSINSSPMPPDFFTSFHSESSDGGRNYVNYQSPLADSLIMALRTSNSEDQRSKFYKAFQRQINQDLPMVFLFRSEETFLYSKRISSLKTSPVRPNYWAPSIKINQE